MGLFDFGKIGDIFQENDGSDSVLDKGKETVKEASVKSVKLAIKGSGLLIRKAYELRINVVNEFSDISPDWGCWDSDTVKNKIASIQKELGRLEKNNKNAPMYDTVSQAQKALATQLLVYTALLPDHLGECNVIIERYGLSTPFALHGILCLRKEQERDFDGALDEALSYYESNNRRSEHPRVSFYATKGLIDKRDYKAAAETMKHTLQAYPEDKAAHELALQLHQCVGNQLGINIEQRIIELL